MAAVIAADPGKAAFQVAAVEELVDDFRDDGSQEAVAGLVPLLVDLQKPVEIPLQALPQRRGLGLSGTLASCPKIGVRIDPELWSRMAGHIERREVIRAQYQTFDGRVSDYELHPYHLLAYHGNWYVMALNKKKEHVATFALSRFRNLEGTSRAFTRPADFNPDAYARRAFGIVGGEKPIKVRLLFEPKLAVYITERQWHPSQEFHMQRDGCVGMRFETTGRKQVVRWILSWMPDVKVLAPKSLRDRVREKLLDGLRSQD